MKRITICFLALFASINMINAQALTVAEAIEVGMALDSMATSDVEYTVEGYVINAGAFSMTYHNQSWYMADDATATTSDFQAYYCYAIQGNDTLKVLNGDKVSVTGKLKKYYNKSAAKYIIEFEKANATFITMTAGDHTVDLSTEEITIARALEIGSALANNGITDNHYKIRGYVSAINVKSSDAYSEAYKNQSFYIADDATSTAASNAEGAFYVYRGKPETEAEIPVGTKVEFTSRIKKYVPAAGGTPVIENADQNIVIQILNDSTPVEEADIIFDKDDFTGQGTYSPGSEVTTIKNGVTFTCDKAYGDNYGIRCYKNGVLTISSAEQQIGKIVFKFSTVSGKYYNGNLDDEIIVNGMSWTTSLTDQARMSKILIYFGEVEVPPTISTDVFPENSGQVISQNDTLLAIPNYGYHFVQWNDSVSENPRSIVLTQDTSFTAIFAPNLYSFNATCDSTRGKIEAENGEVPYLTKISVSAIPNYGYHFTQWSDGITSNPRNITILQDIDLVAYFEPNSYSVLAASNPNGTVIGTGAYTYQTECTLEAIPNYGYHFTQWLDGETANPRSLVVTQDSILGALFEKDSTGLCGKDYALTWTYNSSNQTLTISGNGAFDENMDCGVEAKPNMMNLIIDEGVTAIGAYAFNGCSNLTTMQLPTSLKNIGDRAFANCIDLISIYNYRERPGLVSTTTFDGVNKFDCTLYVLAGSIAMYQSDGSNWKDFYFIEPIGSTAVSDSITDVNVDPTENTVTVTWPVVNDAETYTIEISKDGVVVCTLIFNSNGQLTGIAFAPGRNDSHHARSAIQTSNGGLRFTVTGLDGGTDYNLTVVAKDANNSVVESYSAQFSTTGNSVTTDIESYKTGPLSVTKLLHNGQILILRGDRTYTVTGQEIK